MTGRAAARRLLLSGGRLVHERAGDIDIWTVHARRGRTIVILAAATVLALQADRDLRLRPAGDQLPGFPAEWSQTWTARKRRRPRKAPAAAATASALAGAP